MPYERKTGEAAEEDPEVVAEREYEESSNGSGGSGKKNKMLAAKAAARPTSAPRSSDGDISGNLSASDTSKADAQSTGSGKSAPPTTAATAFKETKALRKKRSRGVSGSSIKKDGGRFDLGMDNLDAYDDVSSDEGGDMNEMEKYVIAHYSDAGVGSDDSNDFPPINSPVPVEITRLRDLLIRALREPCTDEAMAVVTGFLTEHYDEKTRLDLLEKAIDEMVHDDMWTESGALDRLAEYKLVTLIGRVVQEGLISPEAYHEYLKACVDSQTARLLRSAEYFYKTNSRELRGDYFKEVPTEVVDICRDLVRSGEIESVAEALISCPFFHTDVIHQACNYAIETMNMDTIFFIVKAFKALIAQKHVTVSAVNCGVSRFLTELRDTEKDLPAASSLAFLLVSYCIDSPACIDFNVYHKCPRPRKFLRKRTNSSGRLSIREAEDELPEECNESNYLVIDQNGITH